MDKNELQNLIESGYSIRKIANTQSVGYSTVRYWLKKFELKTNVPLKKYICSSCGITGKENFYKTKPNICKSCHNAYTVEKGREKKMMAVDYKGGKCSKCGYDKCIDALEFHHRDPIEKDASFTTMRHWSWERIKKEVDKCDLLCSNCHKEEHFNINRRNGV